jgi:hypothetical protein
LTLGALRIISSLSATAAMDQCDIFYTNPTNKGVKGKNKLRVSHNHALINA